MSRKTANLNWRIEKRLDGGYSIEQAQLAVLMDIRDELAKLNRLLHCPNFAELPANVRAQTRELRQMNRRLREHGLKLTPKAPREHGR